MATKGKKLMEEHKRKLSLAKLKLYREKGHIIGFQKGHPNYTKNRYKFTKEDYLKARLNRIVWNKGKKCPQLSGENNGNWKGGIDLENKRLKNSEEYKNWQLSVFKRDYWTCQICGYKGEKIIAHHIKNWSKYPKLRFEILNGITLCRVCHFKIHLLNYGTIKQCISRTRCYSSVL